MKPWSEVAASPEFQALPFEQKESARNQYFNDVVMPQVKTEDLSAARAQFDLDTEIKKPTVFETVKNFGTTTADIVGDALARERKRRKQEQFDQANAAGKAVVEDSYRSAGPLEVRQAEDRANALALRDESGRATIDTAGEIGRQAVAGVAVDAPKMVNQSLAWFTPDGSAINEFAKEGADYWASGEKDWAQDLEGKGVVGQTLIKGARSMAPSAMVMGAAMANPWVGGAAAATLFGGSQAEDTYERGLQKGLSKDEARKAGWLTGTIEGVGETIGDVAGARFMSGLGKRFLGKIGVKEAEKLAVSPRWAAMFAKDFLENAAIQSATEYGQGFGETAVENRYGISDESPIQQGNEGAQAALGMSVLLGGNAAIGHRQMGQMRKVAGSLLDDAAAPVEQRKEAADFVRDQMEMAGLDKAAAKSWHDGMLATIQHERAPGEQNDSGAISAADILGTAPAFTPADEQAVTSFAQKRLDALEQKANGTEDQAITGPDGKPVTVAGMPAQFLTADERDERDFLRQNIGNPAALAHAYNIKPTDQQEKNSTLAPKAADLADTRPDVPLLRGKPTEFSTETGARISADYALVPAASLITSHDTSLRPNPAYPQELQPRERDRAASETQIATIAQRLDPARLGEAADAANGAPIIGADGLVESGNARTIALKRVYSQGSDKAGAYRQYLKDNAERFGIAPESVDSIENPVLVRVRNTPVNRAEFARQANASTVAQMSPTEQARSDAARIQYMDDLSPTESGDFSTSRDFIRRFVGALPETERGGMMDAGGQLSQSGYARIRNAVLAKAYGNSPALLRMVESLDDNLRNISKALMQAAPQVAKSRDGIAQGALYPIDVTQDLLHAVEELSRLRDAGISVHDALAQTSLVVEDDLRPETKALLQFLDENIRRPRRIADFIRAYVDALDAVGNPNQGSMFGSAVPTRSDLIDSARSTVNAEPTAKEFAPAFSRGEPAQESGSQSDESQSGGTGPGKSEWVAFPPESGTLGIPRAEMPQVKGDHRGALIQYLDGRGITHETLEDQPASDYKPTQAEFSTKKAEKWKNVRDGADRSVLASSDGYILDGHHQWLAALATGEPIKVIKFDAPIRELLAAVHEFPSSHKAEVAGSVDPRERARLDFHAAMAELGDSEGESPLDSKFSRTSQTPANAVVSVSEAPKKDQPLFSRAKTTEKPSLIIHHNISAENLMHAIRMGGIPVPSLAITDKSQAIDGFGDITLIGSKAMADPKGYANTKVFGADIYSPRYPEVEYLLDSKALKKINEVLEPFQEGRPIYGSEIGRVDDLTQNDAFKAYAKSQGANTDSYHNLRPLAEQVLRNAGANERIFTGYTPSGNRRYVPHTLENVVKILKKELRAGEGFSYGVGSLRAKFTPQFKSIEQIHKAKDKLIDSASFEKVREEIDTEFFALSDKLSPHHAASNRFGFADSVISTLQDSARMGIPRALKENGFDEVPVEIQQEAAEFLAKLRNLPAKYFEAKILRDVDLSEFSGAVVPKDIKQEVIDALKSRGVNQIRYYDDRAERTKAVEELADELQAAGGGVLFSRLSQTETDYGKRIHMEDLNAVADEFRKVFPGLPIHPLEKEGHAPSTLRDQIRALGAQNDTAGALHDGGVYLFRTGIRDLAHAEEVAVHEATHYGLNGMFGPEIGPVLLDINRSNLKVQAAVAEMKRKYRDYSTVRAIEEVLADMGPRVEKLKGWDRLVAWVRDKLRQFGKVKEWTDNDVNALVLRALSAAKRGRGRMSVADVERLFEQLLAGAKNAPEIRVVEKPDAFPFPAPEDAKGAYFRGAMAELGDVFRQINPGVRMFTPEEKTKIMPVLVKLFDAGIRLGIMDMKKLMAHVKDALKTHANEWVRKNWNKIDTATYNEAARIALERHDNGVNAKNYTNPKADIPLFSRSTSVWFSQLARAIDGAPDRVFGQAQQVKLWLLSNSGKLGVKKEEIQATGITDWLDTQSRVTKEQVQEFLKNNGVKVEEVTLGEPSEKQAEYERRRNEIENLRDRGGQISAHEAQRRLKELRQELGFDEFGQPVTKTKFHTYQLPGGENYRELLLTLPAKEPARAYELRSMDGRTLAEDAELQRLEKKSTAFISSHFDQPNILAHVRFNERTDSDGKRVLFLEELQSDWAQKGRREGFQENGLPLGAKVEKSEIGLWQVIGPDGYAMSDTSFHTKEEAINAARSDRTNRGVPSAPFVGKTEAWTALALKRMIRWAAENGFDRIAWANGTQQAARYDLSKQIKHINYQPDGDKFKVMAVAHGGQVALDQKITAAELPDIVGKEVAQKIIDGAGDRGISQIWPDQKGPYKRLSGLDLKVGGEGMKGFYDKIVPAVANDVLKKLGGGKVGEIELPGIAKGEGNGLGSVKQPGFDITPALRENVLAGLPMFSRGDAGDGGYSYRAGELKRQAEAMLNGAKNAPEIRVVEKPDAFPFPAPEDAKGAYFRGAIWIARANISSPVDLRYVVAHEVIGHYGLRGFFGPLLDGALSFIHAHNPLIRDFTAKWASNNKDVIREYKNDYGMSDEDIWYLSIEEAMAKLSEKPVNLKGLRRLAALVQQALRAMGQSEWADKLEAKTNAEALDMLRKAGLFVKSGQRYDSKKVAPLFSRLADQTLAKDLEDQEKFLNKEARARGYKSIDELAEKAYPVFEKLAAKWRQQHPVEVALFSRGAGQNDYQYRADQLERAFEAMGLEVRRESSRVSKSEYVEVTKPNNKYGDTLKFRVSDHALPRGYLRANYDVQANPGINHQDIAGDWVDAVEWAADKLGMDVPPVVKQIRSKQVIAAKKAAESSRQWEAKRRSERTAQLANWKSRLESGDGYEISKAASGTYHLSVDGNRVMSLGRDERKGMRERYGFDDTTSREQYFLARIAETETPTASSIPVSSRSTGTPTGGMQERAVRADESGSPAEPAQSGGGAGSDANVPRFSRSAPPAPTSAGSQTPQARIKQWKATANSAIERMDNAVNGMGKMPDQARYLAERYLTLGRIAHIDEIAGNIRDSFSSATPADKKAIYDYLTTRGAASATIQNVGVRDQAEKTKKYIGTVGDQLVKRGLIPQESREEYRDRYLPRLYLAHLLDDSSWRAIGGGKKASDMGYLKQRNDDLPEEYRKVILGEVTDPAFLAASAIAQPMRDMAILDWLGKIVGNENWVWPKQLIEWGGRKVSAHWLQAEADSLLKRAALYESDTDRKKAEVVATEMRKKALATMADMPREHADYKRIPDTPRYGQLRGLMVRREIYDDLVGLGTGVPGDVGFAEQLLGQGGIGSKATKLWKTAKVALNPPGQIRNFISNAVMLQLSGVPLRKIPGLIVRAAKQVKHGGKHWQAAKKYGVTAATFTAQELYRSKRDMLDLEVQMKGHHPLIAIKMVASWVMDKAGDAYQFSEALMKTAKMIDAMEREGMTDEQAALEAQKWLFDYSLVNRNIRYLRNAPVGMPFLTYSAKVAPRLFEVAAKHPLRFLPWVALFYGMGAAAMAMLGGDGDDWDDLKKSLPEWLRKKPHAVPLPWRDSEGRIQFTDIGYFFPWSQWAELGKDLAHGEPMDALRSAGITGGPVPDIITAIKTGIDPFTKKPIADPADPTWQQSVAVMNYVWSMAAPPFLTSNGFLSPMGLFDKQYGGKLVQGVTGTTDKWGDPRATTEQAFIGLAGVNINGVDPDHTRASELQRLNREALDVKAKLVRRLADRSLSEAQRAILISDYTMEMQERTKKAQEFGNSAKVPAFSRPIGGANAR